MRTAYEAINSTRSNHSMSLGFDYSDDFVIFGFNTNSSSSQGQKTTRTLEANGAMSQRVERDGGGSNSSRTSIEVLLPYHYWWSPNGTYKSEQIASSNWTIDGDFSSNYAMNSSGGMNYSNPSITDMTHTHGGSSSSTLTQNGQTENWEASHDYTTTNSGNTLTTDITESSGTGTSYPDSYEVADPMAWLAGQIVQPFPAFNAGQLMNNLISSLVNRYGHWDNVPQELKDQLSGYFEEGVGWVDGPSQQASQIDALMQAMYEKIHSGDLALAGTPDYAGGIGGDHFNDPYNLLPVEARRPAYHGEWIGTASENWLHERFGSEGGGGGSWEQSHDTSFNPSLVPKARIDDLVTDGLATRYTHDGQELIFVDTPMGQLVFKRNAKNEMRYGYTPYGTQYTHFVSVLDDSYSLLDKIGRDYSSATYAETLLKDPAALRRQQAWVTGLTFALHLVPFGAAADELSQGNYGEAGISVAADAALFFVPVGKLAKLRPGAIRGLRGAEIGIEASVGLYRAGQAIDILQREDGTYAEAAGPAGEAMLRLLGISGPVAKELAKLGDYRIEFTPPPSVYAGSGPAGEPQRLLDGMRVVRNSSALPGEQKYIAPLGEAGEYWRVGGHHIHMKSGFKDSIIYSKYKGFSISQEYMKSRGWDHQSMTNAQRALFDNLAESGRPNTIREHSKIAIEALVAGGATRTEARILVAASLRNLRAQGVRLPTNLPWNY